MKQSRFFRLTGHIGLCVGVIGFIVACGGDITQPEAKITPVSGAATPTHSAAPKVTAVTNETADIASDKQTTANFPITIENCDKTFTYAEAPKRAIAFDGNMIDMLLELGLKDRVVGYWTSGATLAPDAQAQLANATEITAEMPGPSREAVLEQSPDFIFGGWEGYGFSEESGLTQAALSELQINSYALSESCQEANDVTTIEDTYADITNIGRIFDVSGRAEQLIENMKAEIAVVKERLDANATPPRVFVYDDMGENNPLTPGSPALLNHLITLAGGSNVFNDLAEDWATVGWESVIERNPEIIVVVDTDWESAADRIVRLKSLPQVADLPAVKEERFVMIHYRQAVSGLQNAEGVRRLAQGIYPDKFQ